MPKNSLKTLSTSEIDAIAARFRALGEASRLSLIKALSEGERNVTDLVEITGLNQPNVSRHLSVLVTAGLVGRRKDGIVVLYRIIDENLSGLCAIVCKSIYTQKKRNENKL